MDLPHDPADSADDPVVASYPVYLNPTLPSGRKLLVLQHPNRLTASAAPPPPSAMRLKPATGMVEVDVPIQTHLASYDRDKGMRWGRALHMASSARAGGALGLPGGFGIGSTPAPAAVGARRKAAAAATAAAADGVVGDDAVLDWPEAVRHDRVLRTQTLGGQIPDSGEVQYMVGVFQGSEWRRRNRVILSPLQDQPLTTFPR
jgi:DNA-directed RNA polymerase-3 subunit RPC5